MLKASKPDSSAQKGGGAIFCSQSTKKKSCPCKGNSFSCEVKNLFFKDRHYECNCQAKGGGKEVVRLNRTKRGQRAHDEKLIQRVKVDKKRGLTVLADLPDMKKPPKLRGYIPDKVVKRREKIIKIEEIETPSTLRRDKRQHDALKKAAIERGAVFKVILAKEGRKKRR